MKYIRATPNPSGAYPAPQSNPFPGAIALTDEQVATMIQYNGFVSITGEGESVTVEPNTEAWEAWKASLPTPPEPEPEPTQTVSDRVSALEAENKLLTAQIEAQSDQLDLRGLNCRNGKHRICVSFALNWRSQYIFYYREEKMK